MLQMWPAAVNDCRLDTYWYCWKFKSLTGQTYNFLNWDHLHPPNPTSLFPTIFKIKEYSNEYNIPFGMYSEMRSNFKFFSSAGYIFCRCLFACLTRDDLVGSPGKIPLAPTSFTMISVTIEPGDLSISVAALSLILALSCIIRWSSFLPSWMCSLAPKVNTSPVCVTVA